jgi:transketolase
VVIVASGSEVPLACQTAARLREKKLAARVLSAPCLELFAAQPEAYQRALLPDDGTPLVAVEAGRGGSFWRLVGSGGLVYGIDRFGSSAPLKALADHYGFTPEKLAARIEAHLAARGQGGA